MKSLLSSRILWSSFLLTVQACTTERAPGPAAITNPGSSGEWSAVDLFAGPTEIVKAPFTVFTCPLRLTSKEIDGISNSNSDTATAIGDSLLIPFRAVVDGAFSGVGYLGGGLIDTVTGGAIGVVGGATGETEPNGTIHCILSGTSE